jgi:hypothetical protein
MPEKRLKANRRFVVIVLAITLIALEGISYVGQRILVGKGVIYQPPSKDFIRQVHEYRPDPLLGWPSPELLGTGEIDSSGSRLIPSFPDPGQEACVSTYGDSFTWGSEVTPEIAWSNVLSELLNCRVSNFGVGGYGTDQAYLRFESNERDKTKVVLLGYFTENLVRNVTQYQGFLYPGRGYRLKPRFILENGALKLVPYPTLTQDEYLAMGDYPAKFLKYDYLIPGGPAGTVRAGFPYTVTLLKSLGNYRIQAQLRGESFWAAFYRKDHPSQALEITTLILQAFDREAKISGRTPIVVMFPWVVDLREYRKNKTWIYQPLIDILQSGGIDLINIGEGLAKHLGKRSPCDLYTACVGSHFNQEGNEVTARLIAEHLKSRNLLTH